MILRKRDQARFDFAIKIGKKLQDLQARGCLLLKDNVPVDPIVISYDSDWVVAERSEGCTCILVGIGYEADGAGSYIIPSVDTVKEIRENLSGFTYVEPENIKKVVL